MDRSILWRAAAAQVLAVAALSLILAVPLIAAGVPKLSQRM